MRLRERERRPRRSSVSDSQGGARAPAAGSAHRLQRTVGNRATTARLQRLKIGKIPPAAWRAAHVGAHAAYHALGAGDAVADFAPATRAGVLAANANHYAAAGGAAPPPAAPAGPAPVSDESHVQLHHRTVAVNTTPEVDHIVPWAAWGSNDPRNARVLSSLENHSPATARPPTFDLVALEADPYLPANRGAVLTRKQVNVLLDRQDLPHVANVGALGDVELKLIYDEP